MHLCLCAQRQQNALKYVTEEWSQIEYELLRERGLWGPPIGSHLDKWMLEMTEGPCRMRKKMVRNDMFYTQYPYMPEAEQETNLLVSVQEFGMGDYTLLQNAASFFFCFPW